MPPAGTLPRTVNWFDPTDSRVRLVSASGLPVVTTASIWKKPVSGRMATFAGSPDFAPGVTRTSTTLSLTMIGVTTAGPLPVPSDRANSRSSTSTSPRTSVMPAFLICLASSFSPASGSVSVNSATPRPLLA